MAYLKDLHRPRCYDCSKAATVKLCNRFNAVNGYYCAADGKRELKRLEEREMAAATTASSALRKGEGASDSTK